MDVLSVFELGFLGELGCSEEERRRRSGFSDGEEGLEKRGAGAPCAVVGVVLWLVGVWLAALALGMLGTCSCDMLEVGDGTRGDEKELRRRRDTER